MGQHLKCLWIKTKTIIEAKFFGSHYGVKQDPFKGPNRFQHSKERSIHEWKYLQNRVIDNINNNDEIFSFVSVFPVNFIQLFSSSFLSVYECHRFLFTPFFQSILLFHVSSRKWLSCIAFCFSFFHNIRGLSLLIFSIFFEIIIPMDTIGIIILVAYLSILILTGVFHYSFGSIHFVFYVISESLFQFILSRICQRAPMLVILIFLLCSSSKLLIRASIGFPLLFFFIYVSIWSF